MSKHRICAAALAAAIGGFLQTGCGGASDLPSDDTSANTSTSNTSTDDNLSVKASYIATNSGLPAPWPTCGNLPPYPTRPANSLNVRNFGAIPDDGKDDTAAIQKALDSMQRGQWLIFPAGTYHHSRSLRVRQIDAVLWSDGATLHATNPADQAIWLSADGASVYRFTLTAVTDYRRTTPWESRIAIFDGPSRTTTIKGNTIRGNKIINLNHAAGPLGNGASSAGIFVFRAENFLVAENTVRRSLADGIHFTGGSRHGRVIGNVVRETGDDMIAVVSYLQPGGTQLTTAQIASQFDSLKQNNLTRNILIAKNDLGNNYWGRGIAVVGGENITIRNNQVVNTAVGASVLITREDVYRTFGVRNVLVRYNTLLRTQTEPPSYVPNSKYRPKTNQAAVEIGSYTLLEEKANATLAPQLTVEGVAIKHNLIEETVQNGIRTGQAWGEQGYVTVMRSDGSTYQAPSTGGLINWLSMVNNTMRNTGRAPISVLNEPSVPASYYCSANTYNGSGVSDPRCKGTREPTVTGAAGICSS